MTFPSICFHAVVRSMLRDYRFFLWVLGFEIVILVLGSVRRGVARVSSWHPKVLPCDNLPRKAPHTQAMILRSLIVFEYCGCVLWLCACGCVLVIVSVVVFVAVFLTVTETHIVIYKELAFEVRPRTLPADARVEVRRGTPHPELAVENEEEADAEEEKEEGS